MFVSSNIYFYLIVRILIFRYNLDINCTLSKSCNDINSSDSHQEDSLCSSQEKKNALRFLQRQLKIKMDEDKSSVNSITIPRTNISTNRIFKYPIFTILENLFDLLNTFNGFCTKIKSHKIKDKAFYDMINIILDVRNEKCTVNERNKELRNFIYICFMEEKKKLPIKNTNLLDRFHDLLKFLNTKYIQYSETHENANKFHCFFDKIFRIDFEVSIIIRNTVFYKYYYEYGNSKNFDFNSAELSLTSIKINECVDSVFKNEDFVLRIRIYYYPEYIIVNTEKDIEFIINCFEDREKMEFKSIRFYNKLYKIHGFMQLNVNSENYNIFIVDKSTINCIKRKTESKIQWSKFFEDGFILKNIPLIVILEKID